jgi:hypothetical protein
LEYLYKHCSGRYLPKPGGMLRLGTLSSFRNEENAFVRDAAEGRFPIEFEFNSVEVDAQWLNEVTFGVMPGLMFQADNSSVSRSIARIPYTGIEVAGEIFVYLDRLGLLRAGKRVQIGGAMRFEFRAFDSFIFCLSMGEAVGSVIHDPLYNSRWKIAMQDTMKFATDLADLLSDHLESTSDWIDKESTEPFFRGDFLPPNQMGEFVLPAGTRIRFRCLITPVRYEPKVWSVSDGSSLARRDIENRIEHSPYTKTGDFSHEQEFRFVFTPFAVIGENWYPMRWALRPVYIRWNSLLHYVEE